MSIKRSFLKRLLLGNLALSIMLILLGGYLFYSNMWTKKWPNTIYYTARLRLTGIILANDLRSYYINVCEEGLKGDEYIKDIEKRKQGL